jgi:hypothetical protein
MNVLIACNEVKAQFASLTNFFYVYELTKLVMALPVTLLQIFAHLLHDLFSRVFYIIGRTLHPKHPKMRIELLGPNIELFHLNYTLTA